MTSCSGLFMHCMDVCKYTLRCMCHIYIHTTHNTHVHILYTHTTRNTHVQHSPHTHTSHSALMFIYHILHTQHATSMYMLHLHTTLMCSIHHIHTMAHTTLMCIYHVCIPHTQICASNRSKRILTGKLFNILRQTKVESQHTKTLCNVVYTIQIGKFLNKYICLFYFQKESSK